MTTTLLKLADDAFSRDVIVLCVSGATGDVTGGDVVSAGATTVESCN